MSYLRSVACLKCFQDDYVKLQGGAMCDLRWESISLEMYCDLAWMDLYYLWACLAEATSEQNLQP